MVPLETGGNESMNVQLRHSIAPIFAAGFMATAMLVGGLTAGASAIGLMAVRAPIAVELVASLIGGVAATAFIGRSKS
jgi:hypothetical protein